MPAVRPPSVQLNEGEKARPKWSFKGILPDGNALFTMPFKQMLPTCLHVAEVMLPVANPAVLKPNHDAPAVISPLFMELHPQL